MQMSVKFDVDKALKGMSRLHKKQMPFAAALGLSMTAKKVAKVEQRIMVRELERPPRLSLSKVLGGRVLIKRILKQDGCTPVFI